MFKCPFPGCNHAASYIIFDSHAREHGFKNMKELCKKHGRVKKLLPNSEALRWAKEQSVVLSASHFDGGEAAASRLKHRANAKNRTD